ncbi:hypothetical protein BDY19DRAFT_963563 [Irpex rosettiformis]|uniref:Uncharacterized protein n=1 Tax=Irpex rosettiformis TaxID=378272 RepID=A0ACB8TV10_9APHY|nr:hypothetical protein BDY19DRAFT_963563 [Irpex rosettiformis]
MRKSTVLFLALIAVPSTVTACEGDCIVGITRAFIGNYSEPVEHVMMTVASQISHFVPGSPTPESAMEFLQPITNAYSSSSYDGMERAIFPNFFHGKCLDDNGVEPDGCPNPDCPLVCGTPGSLVHFYSKLRYIAFNQTRHLLKDLSTPGSDTYNQVERAVIRRENRKTRKRTTVNRSGFSTVALPTKRSEDEVKKKLKNVMRNVPTWIEQVCGGSGSGDTNDLPQCNWEREMKEYILTFP